MAAAQKFEQLVLDLECRGNFVAVMHRHGIYDVRIRMPGNDTADRRLSEAVQAILDPYPASPDEPIKKAIRNVVDDGREDWVCLVALRMANGVWTVFTAWAENDDIPSPTFVRNIVAYKVMSNWAKKYGVS